MELFPHSWKVVTVGVDLDPAASTFPSDVTLSLVIVLQVQNMAKSNASGVLVYAGAGRPLQDMNCVEDECDTSLSVPASMVHLDPAVAQGLR